MAARGRAAAGGNRRLCCSRNRKRAQKTVRHWAAGGAGSWLDKHQEDAAMWLEHLIGRVSGQCTADAVPLTRPDEPGSRPFLSAGLMPDSGAAQRLAAGRCRGPLARAARQFVASQSANLTDAPMASPFRFPVHSPVRNPFMNGSVYARESARLRAG